MWRKNKKKGSRSRQWRKEREESDWTWKNQLVLLWPKFRQEREKGRKVGTNLRDTEDQTDVRGEG